MNSGDFQKPILFRKCLVVFWFNRIGNMCMVTNLFISVAASTFCACPRAEKASSVWAPRGEERATELAQGPFVLSILSHNKTTN